MAEKESARKWAWDRQWKGNILSTCAQNLDPETGAALSRDWAAFFAALPNGARILDIGTGNGIIPLLALGVSEQAGKNFDIHGTDIAAISPGDAVPGQASQLAKIIFHPETPSEHLPFQDASVDAITGQHALEYGDVEATLKEAARVLKPGGRARFLIHASESVIVQSNIPKIEQCHYILEEGKLFAATRKAVDEGDSGGAALQAALNTTREKFKNNSNTKDLTELLELLWDAYEQRAHFPDQTAFHTWLEENEKETLAHKLRIEAMQDAALSEKDIKRLVENLSALGFNSPTLLPAKTADSHHLLGWFVAAGR